MRQWMKCCFPTKIEDVAVKDNMLIESKSDAHSFQGKTNCKNNNAFTDFVSPPIIIKEESVLNMNNESIQLTPKKNEENNSKRLEEKKANNSAYNYNVDPITLVFSNRKISNEEIASSPLLTLTEEQSSIFNGKVLQMNAGGLIGGRNLKDGVALFGFPGQSSSPFKNDAELNIATAKATEDFPYIFAIYYQQDQKAYFIRAYSLKGSYNRILFVKLSIGNDLQLKHKEILSLGNTLLQISAGVHNKIIEIVNLNKKETHTFNRRDLEEITIGRDRNCTIAFPKDKSLSKVQTTIYFNETSNCWVIMDGSKVRPSSNGTWVFGFHSFLINDRMIVEVLDMRIKFSIT